MGPATPAAARRDPTVTYPYPVNLGARLARTKFTLGKRELIDFVGTPRLDMHEIAEDLRWDDNILMWQVVTALACLEIDLQRLEATNYAGS